MISYFIQNKSHLARSNWPKAIALFSMCAAFSACAGLVGSPSGSPGGSNQPTVSLSATSLTFGNQTVGTKSNAESVTLTNTSTNGMTISSIAAGGNFIASNSCGTSLAAGASCTVSATFDPSTTGSLSGTISIADNAVGSPQSISLSGTGTSNGGGGGGGNPGTGCTGTPLSQTPSNVTSQLSYVNSAAGVQVTQLTDNATNRFYYFDVPSYSALVKEILYVNFSTGNVIVTSNSDGTGAQQISAGSTGSQSFLSGDGTLAYFDDEVVGGTPGGVDIFGVLLNSNSSCQQIRLTNLDVPPQDPLPVWEISSSSPDAAGGVDIAFSPDTLVHRVHVLTSGTSEALPTITMNDPEGNATFHRLRLNPKFPNIVLYKRNQVAGTTGQPEAWLADLNTCTNGVCSASQITNMVQNLVAPSGQTPKAGHFCWSPDGLDVLFSEPDIADYWIARNVVNPNGTLNPGFTLLELGPFADPQMTADYCTFPPDWPNTTVVACLAGPASASNAKYFYLMSSDGLGTTKLLAASDAQVLTINGTPMPQFAQDNQHLMFNSDRTGVPQIYLITGFTATVP